MTKNFSSEHDTVPTAPFTIEVNVDKDDLLYQLTRGLKVSVKEKDENTMALTITRANSASACPNLRGPVHRELAMVILLLEDTSE